MRELGTQRNNDLMNGLANFLLCSVLSCILSSFSSWYQKTCKNKHTLGQTVFMGLGKGTHQRVEMDMLTVCSYEAVCGQTSYENSQ